MNLAHIHPGDRVLADVKGRVFEAVVIRKEEGLLHVEPDSRNVTWRTLSARQVKRHVPAPRFDHARSNVTRGP